ncbi:MAG: PilW family protein [Opitutales bacterium]
MKPLPLNPTASPARTQTRRKGFTLVEALVVMGIAGMLMAGVLSFYQQAGLILFTSEQKLRINKDIRTLTNEMTDNARNANHFVLYESFEEGMRTAETEQEAMEYRLRDGESGDMIVLVFYGEDPNPGDNVLPPIERLVGYFRAPDPETRRGPVRKFDLAVPAADQNEVVEFLLPPVSSRDSYPEVVELSEGLADGKLFYNFRDRSIMVNGQIFHGNAAKRVTDTYNFTISPRG